MRRVLRKPFSRNCSGLVLGGSWDLETYAIEEMEKYRYCVRRFVDGLSWEEAGAYSYMTQLFECYDRPDGCANWKDVERRYRDLDHLYEEVQRSRRILSRKELLGRAAFRERGGIYMHFGRDGEPIFGAGGCHRLAIAKILALEWVPVQVGVVHPGALTTERFKQASRAPG